MDGISLVIRGQPQNGHAIMAKRQSANVESTPNTQGQPETPEPDASDQSVAEYNCFLFQSFGDGISRNLVHKLQDGFDKTVTTSAEKSSLHLWLNSPGGDAHAAFKLYREMRARFSKITICVPDFAKSAATLLALGADQLFAGRSADFGPIDAQIEHPDRENRLVSSLAGANSIEHLAKLGIDITLSHGPTLIDLTELPRAEVMRDLLDYSARILEPMLAKLDPQLIHEAAEHLKVTRRYAESIMRSRNPAVSAYDAEVIATKLVTEYPTHGYVIDIAALKELQVACSPIEEHPLWPNVQKVYRVWRVSGRSLVSVQEIQGVPANAPTPAAPHEAN